MSLVHREHLINYIFNKSKETILAYRKTLKGITLNNGEFWKTEKSFHHLYSHSGTFKTGVCIRPYGKEKW
jgi:hypothetical protein